MSMNVDIKSNLYEVGPRREWRQKDGKKSKTGGTKALEDLLENKKIELVKRLWKWNKLKESYDEREWEREK